MIIIIISIITLILGIVGFIIYLIKGAYEDFLGISSAACCILGFICTMAFGIVAITENVPSRVACLREEYKEEVKSLNTTYALLSSNDEIAIVQYNEQVRKFKTEIITNKIKAQNVWFNWFATSCVYLEFDEGAVQYYGIN